MEINEQQLFAVEKINDEKKRILIINVLRFWFSWPQIIKSLNSDLNSNSLKKRA